MKDMKAAALAKIDEAMQMMEESGLEYEQAVNAIKEHVSAKESAEPEMEDSDEPGKGAAKMAAIMALKKKMKMPMEDEDLK